MPEDKTYTFLPSGKLCGNRERKHELFSTVNENVARYVFGVVFVGVNKSRADSQAISR